MKPVLLSARKRVHTVRREQDGRGQHAVGSQDSSHIRKARAITWRDGDYTERHSHDRRDSLLLQLMKKLESEMGLR